MIPQTDPPKNRNQFHRTNTPKNVLKLQDFCLQPKRKHFNNTTCSQAKNLPVFDGKSKKCELFEDLFRNNIKMYPHCTKIRKINYFHSFLRANALQAYCNIEDSNNDYLEEILTLSTGNSEISNRQ